MSEFDNESNIKDVYRQQDLNFKKAMHNTDILSNVIKGFVTEMKEEDIEVIKRCVSPEEMMNISGLNTELINDNDEYVVLDNLFKIDLPNNEKIGLLVNIDGQGDPNPGYPILNRAMVYASGVVFNQKGTVFKGKEFGKLRKVYSIWFILQPSRREMNHVYRYRMRGNREWPKGKKTTIPECDLLEIVIVNLGDVVSKSGSNIMKMMNTIFSGDIRGENRRRVLQDKYKISVDDETLSSLEGIGMSLGEDLMDYHNRIKAESFNAGYNSGRAEEKIVSTSEFIIFLMKENSCSIDKALNDLNVDPSIRDRVKETIESTLNDTVHNDP